MVGIKSLIEINNKFEEINSKRWRRNCILWLFKRLLTITTDFNQSGMSADLKDDDT